MDLKCPLGRTSTDRSLPASISACVVMLISVITSRRRDLERRKEVRSATFGTKAALTRPRLKGGVTRHLHLGTNAAPCWAPSPGGSAGYRSNQPLRPAAHDQGKLDEPIRSPGWGPGMEFVCGSKGEPSPPRPSRLKALPQQSTPWGTRGKRTWGGGRWPEYSGITRAPVHARVVFLELYIQTRPCQCRLLRTNNQKFAWTQSHLSSLRTLAVVLSFLLP